MKERRFFESGVKKILDAETARYQETTIRSKSLYTEALKYLPGGNTRMLHFFAPYPLFIERGKGCMIFDVDGHSRIDFHNNATGLILGHCHPVVVRAVAEQAARGASFHMPTIHITELARILSERIPSVDSIRFTNSGTEATRLAIELAKAFSGKKKIAKFEGGYHGCNEYNVSVLPPLELAGDPDQPKAVPDSGGLFDEDVRNIVVLPYNRINAVEKIVKKYKDELAGIIVEPMQGTGGIIPATPEFLSGLRQLTHENNLILIFDEIQTFRFSEGGAQESYDVIPDLTVLGKIIGGGYPVGAVGGKKEIMNLLDSTQGKPAVMHHGTFNGNPVTMAAGAATMKALGPDEFAALAATGSRVRQGLTDICQRCDIPAQVTGEASFFKIHSKTGNIIDYRSAVTGTNKSFERMLFLYLINRGILTSATLRGVTSIPMTDKDINKLLETVEEACSLLRNY
jgi:glutamate-1-semialdehyde 2,1-aminomutase